MQEAVPLEAQRSPVSLATGSWLRMETEFLQTDTVAHDTRAPRSGIAATAQPAADRRAVRTDHAFGASLAELCRRSGAREVVPWERRGPTGRRK
ncbi:hypothetical protein AAFF_G00203450 [Aldrovandia affinis]|uniref:Uncharacterized protein n=1 Tax=Aldrovandia affinis TaxID=143900 RepID=A0AAD7SX24_9TELE|nr:hypothetical protein AAFF_G00203450 [Aldrovandia affinis]